MCVFPFSVLTLRVKAKAHPSTVPKVAVASVCHFVVSHCPAPGLKWWRHLPGLTAGEQGCGVLCLPPIVFWPVLRSLYRKKSLLVLALLISAPVSLSGGAALQGGKVGGMLLRIAFNAWGASSLQPLLEVLCGDTVYLLFPHSTFYVSPACAMGGSAVAGCSGWLCRGLPCG